jgi:hypothetical protein
MSKTRRGSSVGIPKNVMVGLDLFAESAPFSSRNKLRSEDDDGEDTVEGIHA